MLSFDGIGFGSDIYIEHIISVNASQINFSNG